MFNVNPYQTMQNANQGMIYNQSFPEPAFTNPLNDDDINALRANDEALTLKVTKEEMDKAICTHRDVKSKEYTLVPINNRPGYLRCTICGAELNPEESMNDADIQRAVDTIINILESDKMMYVSIPENVARKFFSMIPFIKKIPKMSKIAADVYQKYVMSTPNIVNDVPYSANPMYTFNNILSGAYPQQQYQQPMYQGQPQVYPQGYQPQQGYPQQQYQQPMYQGQPQVYPQGYPQQQGFYNVNPFDAAANNAQQPNINQAQQGNTQQVQNTDNSNQNAPVATPPAPNNVAAVSTYSV